MNNPQISVAPKVIQRLSRADMREIFEGRWPQNDEAPAPKGGQE